MSDKKLLLALFGPKCVTEVVYGNFTLLMDLVKLLSLQSYRLTERVVERALSDGLRITKRSVKNQGGGYDYFSLLLSKSSIWLPKNTFSKLSYIF